MYTVCMFLGRFFVLFESHDCTFSYFHLKSDKSDSF